MQRIDIWLCDGAQRDDRLDGLVRALDKAGIVARLQSIGAAERKDPAGLLLWQPEDEPARRVHAIGAGAAEILGPWMDPAEAFAWALRFARISATPGAPPSGTQLRLGALEIDLIEREAWREGRTLGLLQREFELLHLLARRSGRPQSRETLLREIWRLGFDPGTNVVEVHVSRLRAKLDRGFDWPMLQTVRGAGYRLVPGTAG